MAKQHKSRSVLSGTHPLARQPHSTRQANSALQILRDAFAAQTRIALPGSAGQDVSKAIAEASQASTLIVPRKGTHAPYHVLGHSKQNPWELLPMRAAALKQYPNILNEACMFFSSLQHAVLHTQPQRLIRCTKVSLDLAKLLRNLGVLAGFEVVHNQLRCRAEDFMWPAGVEPQDYSDLAMYNNLYVKCAVRWDAYKPLWQPPSTSELQEPLHATDALPFAVRHLSKPSVPTLMSPKEVQTCARRLPAGITIMYHNQLGLTVDAVTEQYDVPALALTHLALPWVQVAQIKAALRDKVNAERGVPLAETTPLIHWRLSDWVGHTLQQREAQLSADTQAINRQKERLAAQAATLNRQDFDKAQQSLVAGVTLQNELLSITLLDKLKQAAAIAATTAAAEPEPPEPLQGGGQAAAGSGGADRAASRGCYYGGGGVAGGGDSGEAVPFVRDAPRHGCGAAASGGWCGRGEAAAGDAKAVGTTRRHAQQLW